MMLALALSLLGVAPTLNREGEVIVKGDYLTLNKVCIHFLEGIEFLGEEIILVTQVADLAALLKGTAQGEHGAVGTMWATW